MIIKKVFQFQKRELDWWFFTLLPIILIVLVIVIIPIVFPILLDLNSILFLLIQQLLFYSIILSSTDLALKSKAREKKYQISPPLFVIIVALIMLVCVYMRQKTIVEISVLLYILLVISVFFAYLSIWLYNNNPESSYISAEDFTKTKVESEKKAQENFESPETKTKYGVKMYEKK